MAVISVSFNFSWESDYRFISEEFEVYPGMVSDIDERAEELLEEIGADEWAFDEWEVDTFDDDYADPDKFTDLDAYAEYIDKCEQHGEGYRLRYADIGEFNFDNETAGCWESEEAYGQHLFDEFGNCPDHLRSYIDMEQYTKDMLANCSTYEGREGVHIFND